MCGEKGGWRSGSLRINFHGCYTVRRSDIPSLAQFITRGAAFSAFDFFPGGAPRKPSDGELYWLPHTASLHPEDLSVFH
jgi:hypothetical protein